MKRLLGMSLLVAAGCATQPDEGSGPARLEHAAVAAPLPPKAALSARVGVEYLPPVGMPSRGAFELPFDARIPGATVRAADGERPAYNGLGSPEKGRVQVEPAYRSSPPAMLPREELTQAKSQEFWLTEDELGRIEDPAERLTLNFLNYLIGEDRRRIQREVGIPALFDTWRNSTPIHGPETVQDQRMREDMAVLMSRQHGSLLNRPMRRAFRRSSFLRDIELMYEDLKSQVPLSGSSEPGEGGGLDSPTNWGRVSVSVRVNNPRNFFDFTYRRSGWRIGSSPTRLKLGYERRLSDKLFVSLRTRYHYDENDLDMWGDVHYRVNRDTSFHLMSGNKIDVTTGAAMLPVIQSPVVLRTGEASPGFMFYVEHMF